MYQCPHCGGRHRSAETGKKCAEDLRRYGTRDGVAVYDARTGRRKVVSPTKAAEKAYDAWATSLNRGLEDAEIVLEARNVQDASLVRNGHYYLPPDHWKGDKGLHALVRHFREGRWKNVWFVTVFEEDGTPALLNTPSEREYVFAKIVKAGPSYCMAQYGRLFSRCGICNEELTEEEREESAGHVECFEKSFPQHVVKT